jgi:NDP-sugar pyrophosphorylase family protein
MAAFIARAGRWPVLAGSTPWAITMRAAAFVADASTALDADFRVSGSVAVHQTAIVESGAVVKGPAIIGPRCFVAASAYLRGGVLLEEDCIIGPGVELKASLMFKGGKLAHFNFVGDSILGEGVNLEAGSVIANYRNDRDDKRIRIATAQGIIDTGTEKFGALIGDGVRIGANAVIAPGALIAPHTVVPRLRLVDQSPEAA